MLPASSCRLLRISTAQNLKLLGWSSQSIIKLISGMHPEIGYSFHNRMIRITRHYEKFMANTVTPSRSRRLYGNEFFISDTEVRTVLFGSSVPTSQSDDFIISLPIWKSIVSSVYSHKTTTLTYELLKSIFRVLRPR